MRGSKVNNSYTAQLLRRKSYNCAVSNLNGLLMRIRCPICDQINKKSGSLERHSTTCMDRGTHFSTKNVDQLRDLPFDKLTIFDIPYTDEHKRSKGVTFLTMNKIARRITNWKIQKTRHKLDNKFHFPLKIVQSLKWQSNVRWNWPTWLCFTFIETFENLAAQK